MGCIHRGAKTHKLDAARQRKAKRIANVRAVTDIAPTPVQNERDDWQR